MGKLESVVVEGEFAKGSSAAERERYGSSYTVGGAERGCGSNVSPIEDVDPAWLTYMCMQVNEGSQLSVLRAGNPRKKETPKTTTAN